MPAISSAYDGFLRMPLDAVLSTRLVHVISALDDDCKDGMLCGQQTLITGYTEWASLSAPRVSLGWDWQIDARYGDIRCARIGLPRSNVMLVDSESNDYGWIKNLEVLATVVDAIAWADQTRQALSGRYA